MPIPYEILIRGEKGAFKGAHVIDVPGGDARAIKTEDWPAFVTNINNTAFNRVAELEASLQTATQVKTERDALLKEKTDAEKPAKVARLQEEIQAKQAELAALNQKSSKA